MLKRALLFCEGENKEKRYKVVKEVGKLFSARFSENVMTSELAYERNKIIEDIIEKKDPLKKLKEDSFLEAKKLYPPLKAYLTKIKDPEKRFKKALMIALAGNLVEFRDKDHDLNLKNLEKEIWQVVEGSLAVGEIDQVYEKIKSTKEILYVTDNTGELIFDRIFLEELEKYVKIDIAPLSRPCQDDATVEYVKKAGITAEIIPRSDFIGVWFPRCTPEFLKKWEEVDFIIAKGMACYETLSEYPEKTKGKVAALFKVKCQPVAKEVGVKLGGAAVKIL